MHEYHFDLAIIADHGVNYISFTETCVNSSKLGYHTKLVDAYNGVIPTGSIRFTNTPNYLPTSFYQPGGVAAGFDAVLSTRLLREGSDLIGGWVWQEFGQNDRILRIYTVYRVNDGSVFASGECTAWAKQYRHLQKLNNMTNPRKQIMIDLRKELNDVISRGLNVVVAEDFNEGLMSPEGM